MIHTGKKHSIVFAGLSCVLLVRTYLHTCFSSLEWAPLTSLVAKAQEPRGCLKRLSDSVRNIFNIANVTNPEDEGVIDHMVSVTTALRSPFIALTCHTVSY